VTTTYRSILPALALGSLLAASAWGQHHSIHGNADYDPEPRGGDPNAPPGCVGVQAKIEINGTSTAFEPATVTIDKGQPVCWTWSVTGITHNIKASDDSFTSGPPAAEGTFQKTFNFPGTFGFHCQVHGTPSTGMRGTIIVRDPDASGGEGPGTLELTSTYTVNENAGSVAVTVERVGGSDGAASVKYQTAPGSAKPNKDFTTRKGTLKWTDGDTEPKSITVPIKNDSAIEADESFTVKLSKATGAGLGNAISTVGIHDDDGPQCDAALVAPSQLRAVGSDGEIRLSWDDKSLGASAFRIERRQDGGEFRRIASVAAGERTFVDSGLAGGATFQYRVRAEGTDGVSAFSAIAAGASDGSTTACDDTRALCLHNGRFEATVEWHAPGLNRETKRLFTAEAPSWGLFFSADDAPQLLLNVRDGCDVNDRYWLDLGAVTDDAMTVTVRDTQTGRTWVYFNPAGSRPAPVHDIEAFATCP